jgi:hypothetical protein
MPYEKIIRSFDLYSNNNPVGIEDKKGKRIFKKRYSGRKPEDARKALDEAVYLFLVTAEDFRTAKNHLKRQAITDESYIQDFKPAPKGYPNFLPHLININLVNGLNLNPPNI